jgi:hypothetical protein
MCYLNAMEVGPIPRQGLGPQVTGGVVGSLRFLGIMAGRVCWHMWGGVERTEVKLGIKPGAHDDPITYHRLTN